MIISAPLDTLYEAPTEIHVTVPARQLAKGSLEIHTLAHLSFANWTTSHHAESFRWLQRIAQVWRSQNIQSFLVLGRISLKEAGEFYWEVVPYPNDESAYWQQIQTAYTIFFGGMQWAQERTEEELHFADIPAEQESSQQPEKPSDYFCRKEIIDRQKINSDRLESNHTNLLYNYKPLLPDHLLIVPKQHRANFVELREQEYLESMTNLTVLFTQFSKDPAYERLWVYHKTGERAGQTVPHWHAHVVGEDAEISNWEKMGRVSSRIFFPCLPPISQDELEQKIHHYQKFLAS